MSTTPPGDAMKISGIDPLRQHAPNPQKPVFSVGVWSVAAVKGREEKAVEERLRQRGFYTFLPMVTVTQRRLRWEHGRRVVRRESSDIAMFERYVFVAWECPEQRGDILATRGVQQLIPAPNPDRLARELETLKMVLNVKSDLQLAGWIRPGDRARITTGPFAGVVGAVQERKGHRVFLVGVEILGGGVQLEVEDWEIEPASIAA